MMVSPGAFRLKSERLESAHNRWLKRFRAALQGNRDEGESALGLEGARLVGDALRSGMGVEALLVSDSGERHLSRLKPLLPADVRLLRTTDRLFAGVADTETPQGVAVLVAAPNWKWDDLPGPDALVIVLAGVQDPGNVGAIVRSAEALGASALVACRGCAHPLAPKAVRASAGSVLRLPTFAGATPKSVLEDLRRRGMRQHAATLSGERRPQDADFSGPCALWIGSEGAGLPPEIEAAADARIRIPLRATVESLNAAAAAAVLLYEAARQRDAAGRRASVAQGTAR